MRQFLLIIVLLAAVVGACNHSSQISNPLSHEIYVWQRVWTPEVRVALQKCGNSLNHFAVLAGELSLSGAEAKSVRPELDYAALAAIGKPIGLAIRIGPYSGPFRKDDTAFKRIIHLANDRIANAKQNGIEPAELQIDFDCADSKLDGYRIWLQALRKAVAPLPVHPTVLPSWLSRTEFKMLAKESGGFILQVHSVKAPGKPIDTGKLTDPVQARKWVEQAASLNVPFRVALPTYTYLVAFDQQNNIRGISAEGPSSRWPSDARILRWEADPKELAELVKHWTENPPPNMTGIIWYRLPVSTDSLNWRWKTLTKVINGQTPRHDLRLESNDSHPSEIVLINAGECDEPLPEIVEIRWTGARLLAADALNGYELETNSNRETMHLRFRRKPSAALYRLPPETRRNIGWIRCETPTQIRVSIGETVTHSHPGSTTADTTSPPGDRF